MNNTESVAVLLAGGMMMGIGLILLIPMVDKPENHYSNLYWIMTGTLFSAGFLMKLHAYKSLGEI